MRCLYQISRLKGSRRSSLGLLIAAVMCTNIVGSASRSSSHAGVLATGALSTLVRAQPTEVRLRRLHLVRPDLIPYPIVYEVFC
jgi:hypothetical protein